MKGFAYLKKHVIETDLCVHCGTCVGVCPANALEIEDILGKCLPCLAGRCTECGLCFQTCPGERCDLLSLWENPQTKLLNHPMLGRFSKIFVGHAQDGDIRYRGASGGIGTAILLQLFEQKEVDGVVVLDFCSTKPWLPEVKIAKTREEIVQAAQSKYFIYPHNKILKVLRESSIKEVAYLGLPCQVHGIRKAIQNRVPGTEKIKYILGIYCGNNLYYEASLSLFKRFGIDNLNRIKKLSYRDGEYPGNFVVEDKNGKNGIVDKFTFNYLSFFYTPFRCHLCVDQTNELSDISIGDAWKGTYVEKSRKGHSIIVVRNPALLSLLERRQKGSRYIIAEITEAEAVRMHSNVLDNKKVGAYARMDIWHRLGRETPKFSLNGRMISFKRYCFELVNLLVLVICALNISRQIISRVPINVISPLMKSIRGTWRKRTA